MVQRLIIKLYALHSIGMLLAIIAFFGVNTLDAPLWLDFAVGACAGKMAWDSWCGFRFCIQSWQEFKRRN